MRVLLIVGALLWFGIAPVTAGEGAAKAVTAAPSGTPWVHYLDDLRTALGRPGEQGIVLNLFPSGLLGGELHTIQQLRRGRIAIGLLTTASLASVTPSLQVLDLPYLWVNAEESDYVLDHQLKDFFAPALERRGIVLLAFNASGTYHMVAARPLLAPAQARGLRPRAMQAGISLAFWRDLEANPIALAYPDVSPSLQTGLINGLAIELQSIYYGGYYKFAPHVTLTGHALEVGALVASKAWFDTLTTAQQGLLRQAAIAGLQQSRNETRSLERELIKNLRQSGAIVHDLSKKEQQVWVQRLDTFRVSAIKKLGPSGQAAYDRIVHGKAAFAKDHP